ncbi:RNA1 (YMR235C) [Zygosaccharomyces parabailii]|nr:RNA1 (YMR235C) [Zygosaccharomyces parabailii]CDH15857.1 probable Ran GTPase-activating protein 1 [Zygosaccharomyces bailii ISA1307]SJM82736.1 probable Ran GTPase-activating protein 1 [Zygosaccharomyces bailii]
MATLHFQPTHELSETFSLQGQALKLTTKEDIQPHLDALEKLKKVTKLDLSGNTIGVEASEALADFIKTHDSVRLNLQEANFADLYTSRLVDEVVGSLTAFLPVFLQCEKLEILNLSDNAFGLRTIDQLESYISNAVHLKHLILSNNGMGPHAGERIGKALFLLAQNKRKQNLPFLETFICGRNRLENGSCVYLALGLKAHGDGLKNVKLYQNGIRPKGVATLLHYGLKFNKNLKVLDLQDNTFTKVGSSVLADCLPIWSETLEELNLNDCLLKKIGANQVFSVFLGTKFTKLAVLKAEYNEMVQETLEDVLIPALVDDNLPMLTQLELNGNWFEEDSEPLDLLQGRFPDLDLDDLEEPDSEEEEEEEDKAEQLDHVATEELEKELAETNVDNLATELSKTHI